MKIFGVDTDRNYSDEEIQEIRKRFDGYLLRIIYVTVIVCVYAALLAVVVKFATSCL